MKLFLLSFLLLFSMHSFAYKYETVLDNLDDAWSFVFLNEDTILFTEMPGKLKIVLLIMLLGLISLIISAEVIFNRI